MRTLGSRPQTLYTNTHTNWSLLRNKGDKLRKAHEGMDSGGGTAKWDFKLLFPPFHISAEEIYPEEALESTLQVIAGIVNCF